MIRTSLAVALFFSLTTTAAADDIRIGTWNLEWFCDHEASDDPSTIGPGKAAPDEQEYGSRVTGFAAAIASLNPHVMALQEIENSEVVEDIAAKLESAHDVTYRVAFVPGADSYTGQDVAFLVKDGVTFERKRFNFTQIGMSHKDLSKHLHLTATIDGRVFQIVTVHLITNGPDRKRQARTLREWTAPMVGENFVVLGDFNFALRFNETAPDSDVGIIRGFGSPIADDDLFDAHMRLNAAERRTHVDGRELDRILLSPSLIDEQGLDLLSITQHRDLAVRGSADTGSGVAYGLPEASRI